MNKINWPNNTEFINVYNQLKSAKKLESTLIVVKPQF